MQYKAWWRQWSKCMCNCVHGQVISRSNISTESMLTVQTCPVKPQFITKGFTEVRGRGNWPTAWNILGVAAHSGRYPPLTERQASPLRPRFHPPHGPHSSPGSTVTKPDSCSNCKHMQPKKCKVILVCTCSLWNGPMVARWFVEEPSNPDFKLLHSQQLPQKPLSKVFFCSALISSSGRVSKFTATQGLPVFFHRSTHLHLNSRAEMKTCEDGKGNITDDAECSMHILNAS